jgi:diguanylate cyclase (GGDEF)-like protein/PAS domain S-box-containing protein/putative nucleotidyltransferase with HDIG domain
MKNKDNRPKQADPSASSRQALHRRAEEMAREKAVQSPEDLEVMSPEEMRQMLHELRVHQLELEMQNEELRRAQVELDTARARYFDLYDMAPVGYCTITVKGLILEANLTTANLLGVARGALIKQPFYRFILNEDKNIYYLHRKQLFETGEQQAFELRIVKKDGTAFWAHLAAIAVQNIDGVPVCRIALSDIIERKQAEDAQWSNQKQLTDIIEFLPDATLAIDKEKRVIIWNKAIEKMTGIPAAEMIGKCDYAYTISFYGKAQPSLMDLVFLDDEETASRYPKLTREGDTLMAEVFCPALYNNIGAWVSAKASPLHDQFGNIIGAIESIRDITERKQAEDALKISEEKYRLLTEHASDVIWVLNLTKNKFTYISPSILHLRGFTAEEAMNESLEESLTAESLVVIREAIARNKNEFIENPKAPNYAINEIQQPCKNGDIIWVEVSTKYLYNADGDLEVVGVSRNIEERKKAQEEVLYLSYHDQLTGLYNRRYFDNAIKRLDEQKCVPVTLVMADVNGLKLTNDAFGHKVGDMLLEKVAKVLKRECRTEDIAARIGGDEFVLLLPETDSENAKKIINRINAAIANEKIDNVILSISIGAAVKQDISDDVNEVFKKAEDEMYRHKLSEGLSMRSKTIDIIMNTLYEKSNREMLHSKRVSEICEAIASKLNFAKDDVNQIRIAGLMHDIGKIGIDEKILNKPQELNSDERNEIERHSEIGYRILSSVNEFSEIASYVLEHHESWNGKGYPRGLKGEEILLQARIIAIADAFDAMKSARTYRKALSEEEAIIEIRRCSNTQFDPTIVRIFIDKVLGK